MIEIEQAVGVGIVEEEGSPDVLFDSPKSTRLKQFLSAAAN